MRRAPAVLIPIAAALLWPAAAAAHGLVGRAFLPVPAWLFAWAAAIVLVASFIGLGALWRSPKLERAPERKIIEIPAWVDAVCGAIGVALFGLVVISGIFGTQTPANNLAPTAVFVLFWVGIPILSVLLGDVFALFNPWLTLARAIDRIAPAFGPPRPYTLGHWPAAATIVAFGWLELVYVHRDRPAMLAVLAVAYALVQLVAMSWFGIEAWNARGDGFAVAFNFFSRLAPIDLSRGTRRPLLSATTTIESQRGTVLLIAAMLGTTTFDGFLNGPVWRALRPDGVSYELSATVGLALAIALCLALYNLGAPDPRRFIHSLIPIAFGYLLAHYFSLLVTQGQATAHLIADPLGHGAPFTIDYSLFSTEAIWYVQVAALIAGHVCGLALAHDRALVLYRDPLEAARSQRWMLAVMVSFTCLGLWLLSAVNT